MPKKCYCEKGFFGKHCELESPIKDISSFDSYNTMEMSESLTMYWKILTDEIEVGIKSRTKTWIAVGWRPANLTKACKSFWGSTRAKVPRFRFRRQATEELSDEEIKKFTPKHEFHDMDCTDIVVGVARGELGRVVDSYTRDRSTPLEDEMYGGESDLTAAIAYEDDEGSVMVFRKPLQATHPSDHSVEQGLMHVIWAHGQTHGQYSHAPRSGIEADEPSIPDFYKEDELKYHGKKNRGDRKMELLTSEENVEDDDECSFKDPPHCSDDCQYSARWQYKDGKVSFLISSSNDINSKWMGIGFSSNTFMVLLIKIILFCIDLIFNFSLEPELFLLAMSMAR